MTDLFLYGRETRVDYLFKKEQMVFYFRGEKKAVVHVYQFSFEKRDFSINARKRNGIKPTVVLC